MAIDIIDKTFKINYAAIMLGYIPMLITFARGSMGLIIIGAMIALVAWYQENASASMKHGDIPWAMFSKIGTGLVIFGAVAAIVFILVGELG